MPSYDRKNLRAGKGYGVSKQDESFLDSDSNPWEASASGQGYNARFDDDAGDRNYAGHGVDGRDDSEAFLRPSTPRAHEATEDIHERLYRLIDGQVDMPAGKWLGGGGPVSDNIDLVRGDDGSPSQWGGSGRSAPRYAPKTGPQGNMKGHK